MQYKKEKIWFLLYITGFLIMALTIALLQPLADTPPLFPNPPDEHARFLIPQYICEHGRIPTGFEEEVRIPTYGFSYVLYNAFPYIIQGFLMRLVSFFTKSQLLLLYTARLVNVASGVCMAVVVYLLSKKVFQETRFRWLFCFAVMYLPQNLFTHTYVNTDSMCLLSTAMMVYALVSAYREGFTRANCLWLIGGIVLCALSYYNAYGYILSSMILFLVYFLQKEQGHWYYDWRNMLKKGFFISILVLAGIGWWFVRSYLLYDGDFLGLETRQNMAAQYADPVVNPLYGNTFQQKGYTIWQMMKEKKFAECVFYSFVAAFGSVSITGNIWLYRFYKIFFAIGLGANVLFWPYTLLQSKYRNETLINKKSQTIQKHSFRQGKTIVTKCTFFHFNMIFCAVMPLILLIQYAYTMDYQDQGRYLLPSVIPFMYYITAGFDKLAQIPKVPSWCKKMLPAVLLTGIIIGTLWMVYGKALPIYLQELARSPILSR